MGIEALIQAVRRGREPASVLSEALNEGDLLQFPSNKARRTGGTPPPVTTKDPTGLGTLADLLQFQADDRQRRALEKALRGLSDREMITHVTSLARALDKHQGSYSTFEYSNGRVHWTMEDVWPVLKALTDRGGSVRGPWWAKDLIPRLDYHLGMYFSE